MKADEGCTTAVVTAAGGGGGGDAIGGGAFIVICLWLPPGRHCFCSAAPALKGAAAATPAETAATASATAGPPCTPAALWTERSVPATSDTANGATALVLAAIAALGAISPPSTLVSCSAITASSCARPASSSNIASKASNWLAPGAAFIEEDNDEEDTAEETPSQFFVGAAAAPGAPEEESTDDSKECAEVSADAKAGPGCGGGCNDGVGKAVGLESELRPVSSASALGITGISEGVEEGKGAATTNVVLHTGGTVGTGGAGALSFRAMLPASMAAGAVAAAAAVAAAEPSVGAASLTFVAPAMEAKRCPLQFSGRSRLKTLLALLALP